VIVLALAAALAAPWAGPAAAAPADHLTARSSYLERCGGCHGVDGRAFAPTVPDLRGRAGWFLCDPAGRDYVARLPNIVFSHLTDGELADLLNYVVFDLGGDSAPKGAHPYGASEVARTRRNPLSIPDLEAYRAGVVQGLIARCGAPAGLATDYAPILGPRDHGTP
jgi:mono/diheme cytochrome c family protein